MPNQSASSSTWDRMCEFTAGLVEKHAVPGVAVGLFHAGDTHTAGFGVTNVNHPLPVTPATLFQVGSITKTFTATLIIRLVEMDKLDLDAPVRSYVPEFRVADKDTSARATVRHLLTHTGGWPGDVFLDTGGGDDALTRYVAAMADLEQLAPLGTIWSYNNAGFYLAGHIVELVTGKSYRDALAELVLEPLGLRNIFFDPAEVMTHRFAVGHDVADGKPEVARPWALPRAVHPVGGIICDVPALLRYARFQIEAGKTEQGRQLLSPSAMAQMHSTQVTIGGHHEAMGLSWFINHADGVKQISHGGGTKGQVSLLLIVPERRFAVAILTNADQGGFVTRDVSRWLLKQYLGLEITDPEPKDAPAERLAPYTGRYTRPYADVELGLLAGKLVGQVVYKQGFPSQDVPPAPPPPPMTLALYDDDRLIVTDGPFKDTRAQILRTPDGGIGWLRFGTRIHVRQRAEDTEPPA